MPLEIGWIQRNRLLQSLAYLRNDVTGNTVPGLPSEGINLLFSEPNVLRFDCVKTEPSFPDGSRVCDYLPWACLRIFLPAFVITCLGRA
jgi:hypothetical protein